MNSSFDLFRSPPLLDLRSLEPVEERTCRGDADADELGFHSSHRYYSDWLLSGLLERNGYVLFAAKLWHAEEYIGYDFGDCGLKPYSVLGLRLYGLCCQESTGKVFGFRSYPWFNHTGEDEAKLEKYTEGYGDYGREYSVDDAVIRFTRTKSGVLKESRWMKAVVEGSEFSLSGWRLMYVADGQGYLRRYKDEAELYYLQEEAYWLQHNPDVLNFIKRF